MILKWSQSRLLLLESHLLLHSTCIVFLLQGLYNFRIFSASFLMTFLSPEIATSINIHVLFSLSLIIMSGLLLGMVLSVWTCWFYSIVTLLPWPVSTDFGTCSYQCFFPIVPLFLYICWSVVMHTLYRVFLCTVLFVIIIIIIIIIIINFEERNWE
jgi:hypothetical protein